MKIGNGICYLVNWEFTVGETDNREILELKAEVTDSLSKILKYCGCEADEINECKALIKKYIAEKDDDKKRELRKVLNNVFFNVYKDCTIKSFEDDSTEVPLAVRMFFLHGFMDENIAGLSNSIILAKFTRMYKSGTDGVVSLYEWLYMVYKGLKSPSMNDMSLDYEQSLRERLRNREITQGEFDSLIRDRHRRFGYEINNAVSIMKRVSGSPTRFLAMFAEESLEKPLPSAILSNNDVRDELDKIIKVDINLFWHEYTYANKDVGLENVRIVHEIKPDIVLLPIIGSRPMMWQEIEGRNRQSAARFFYPRFLNTDLRDTLIRVCGNYRWEYCKREQGARWQDISDPSLCSLFYNYLQTYRKNHHLMPEQKEKITAQYNKFRHNIKDIFVDDYVKYIQNEAEGHIRLNKLSREILIKFCVLNKDIRTELLKNTLYVEYINYVNNKMEHDKKLLVAMKKRIEDNGSMIPPEIREYEMLINR